MDPDAPFPHFHNCFFFSSHFYVHLPVRLIQSVFVLLTCFNTGWLTNCLSNVQLSSEYLVPQSGLTHPFSYFFVQPVAESLESEVQAAAYGTVPFPGPGRPSGRTIYVPPRTFSRTLNFEPARGPQRPTTLPLRTLPAISITTPDTRSAPDTFFFSASGFSSLSSLDTSDRGTPHLLIREQYQTPFIICPAIVFPAEKMFCGFQPELFTKFTILLLVLV